jgi:hypothetical protein
VIWISRSTYQPLFWFVIVFAVIAMWVFPEAVGKKGDKPRPNA